MSFHVYGSNRGSHSFGGIRTSGATVRMETPVLPAGEDNRLREEFGPVKIVMRDGKRLDPPEWVMPAATPWPVKRLAQ